MLHILKLYSIIHLVEAILADGRIDREDLGRVLDFVVDILQGKQPGVIADLASAQAPCKSLDLTATENIQSS